MSGGWKRAQPAGNRPLDGRVRRLLQYLTFEPLDEEPCFSKRLWIPGSFESVGREHFLHRVEQEAMFNKVANLRPLLVIR